MEGWIKLLAEVDTLSGGAGWVGAGLLGAVLAWLMLWHLPAKDKQMGDLITGKDAHIIAMTTAKELRIDAQRKEFTEALASLLVVFRAETLAERMACEKHFATLATTMDTALRTLGDQLKGSNEQMLAHSQRNQQWLDLLKKQVEDAKGK